MKSKPRRYTILPGFGLSLGWTIAYLSMIVLIPLAALFLKTSELGFSEIWRIVSHKTAIHAYVLSFKTALTASLVSAVFGLVVAWVLTRYSFPGKRILDALIDLPFALPTAVAGISLTALYAKSGWFGSLLDRFGIQVVTQPLGIVIALVFIGFPFVVRTLQPVLEDLDPEIEEAAASLGASRLKTFTAVIFPHLLPAWISGIALSFARSIGEYGSVVFIAGNIPNKTTIAPLLIMQKLENHNHAAAAAIGLVMLLFSFLILFLINRFQYWQIRKTGGI